VVRNNITTIKENKKKQDRFHLIDSIRGLTIISMVLFHACWDMVYLFLHDWPWYVSSLSYVWQQSICWTFILISGFCFYFSKRHLKRGAVVFAAGIVITIVTLLFMEKGNGIVFGILTFMGSAMLIFTPLDKYLKKISPVWGIIINAILFFISRNINIGYLGFEKIMLCKLPETLFKGYFMTYLGFRDLTFYSTDYFSIMPWIFLFGIGYFICPIVLDSKYSASAITEVVSAPSEEESKEKKGALYINVPVLSFIGRHSLLVYMLHQPIVYIVLMLWHKLV